MSPKTIKSWISRIGKRKFRFTIKAPGSISHEKLIADPEGAAADLRRFEETHITPLITAEMMGALLIQLPPAFQVKDLEKLSILLRSATIDRYPVFVEPRNTALFNNPDMSSALRESGAGLVSVDSPAIHLEQNEPGTGMAYVRLHGRNAAGWWTRGAGKQERYDYEYNSSELSSVAEVLKKKIQLGDEIFVYFNNHPSGNAPRNATSLLHHLGMGGSRGSQTTLL